MIAIWAGAALGADLASCAAGDGAACARAAEVASALEAPLGPGRAEALRVLGCEAGHTPSCFLLTRSDYPMLDAPPLELACSAGDVEACARNVAAAEENDEGLARALDLACAAGVGAACERAGDRWRVVDRHVLTGHAWDGPGLFVGDTWVSFDGGQVRVVDPASGAITRESEVFPFRSPSHSYLPSVRRASIGADGRLRGVVDLEDYPSPVPDRYPQLPLWIPDEPEAVRWLGGSDGWACAPYTLTDRHLVTRWAESWDCGKAAAIRRFTFDGTGAPPVAFPHTVARLAAAGDAIAVVTDKGAVWAGSDAGLVLVDQAKTPAIAWNPAGTELVVLGEEGWRIHRLSPAPVVVARGEERASVAVLRDDGVLVLGSRAAVLVREPDGTVHRLGTGLDPKGSPPETVAATPDLRVFALATRDALALVAVGGPAPSGDWTPPAPSEAMFRRDASSFGPRGTIVGTGRPNTEIQLRYQGHRAFASHSATRGEAERWLGWMTRTVTTDPTGGFVVPDLPYGGWELVTPLSTFPQGVRLTGPEAEIALARLPCSVTVVDERGAPVPKAEIHVDFGLSGQGVVVADEGGLAAHVASAGAGMSVETADGRRGAVQIPNVVRGGCNAEIRLRVPGSTEIRPFELRDDAGAPLVGWRLRVKGAGGRTTTDAEGNGWLFLERAPTSDETGPVEVEALGGSGRRDLPGLPWSGPLRWVVDRSRIEVGVDAPAWVAVRNVDGDGQSVNLAQPGTATFRDLPGGRWELTVVAEGRRAHQWVDVAPAGTVEVAVETLPVSARPVTLVVVDPQGDPVPGAAVDLPEGPVGGSWRWTSARARPPEHTVYTDALGRATIDVPEGEWLLEVSDLVTWRRRSVRVDAGTRDLGTVRVDLDHRLPWPGVAFGFDGRVTRARDGAGIALVSGERLARIGKVDTEGLSPEATLGHLWSLDAPTRAVVLGVDGRKRRVKLPSTPTCGWTACTWQTEDGPETWEIPP